MEELERKRERNRQEYLKNRDKRMEQSRKWYSMHKDYFYEKTRRYRERKRNETLAASSAIRPSIESQEAVLPYELRRDTERLRREFLKIPIQDRPTYDVFIRQKTAEYYKQLAYERNNKQL